MSEEHSTRTSRLTKCVRQQKFWEACWHVSRPELHVRSRDVSSGDRSVSLRQNSMLNTPTALVTSRELTWYEDSVSPALIPLDPFWITIFIHKLRQKFYFPKTSKTPVDCVWNLTAQAQKPDFVFRRNGRVHSNRRWGRQFSRLLAAELCASAVVMLDKPCSEVVWRVLATHFIRQLPLQFPSRASPCVVTFQLDSATALSWIPSVCLSWLLVKETLLCVILWTFTNRD
jgi:hypothetical protein